MKPTQSNLAEQAAPLLGEALADLVQQELAQGQGDREHQRYVLADLNNLLLHTAGSAAELFQNQLSDPNRLRSHLRASLEIPAQALAKALPSRLSRWVQAQSRNPNQDRQAWALEGRFLLEQVMKGGGQ
jgi:hypothetical protein